MKSGAKTVLRSERPLVFVAPTYTWRMPKVVSDWIESSQFHGNRHTYFILTCGGSIGNAAAYAKRLCENKKLQYCGLALVAMPNNYVALSYPPGEDECRNLLEKAESKTGLLASLIQKGKPQIFHYERITRGGFYGLLF